MHREDLQTLTKHDLSYSTESKLVAKWASVVSTSCKSVSEAKDESALGKMEIKRQMLEIKIR